MAMNFEKCILKGLCFYFNARWAKIFDKNDYCKIKGISTQQQFNTDFARRQHRVSHHFLNVKWKFIFSNRIISSPIDVY